MISVIIPSRNPVNLAACTAAVREHEPDADIVCVWDMSRGNQGLPAQEFTVIEVKSEDFNFSRNVNIGIQSAVEGAVVIDTTRHTQQIDDGFVILGDDGLLESPGGFSLLAEECRAHPEFGLIAATTNNVGNRNQFPRGVGLREDPRMVCFIAVYVPRSTIERVGLLDEDFTAYSHQDDDYCLRVRRAGLKIGIHDGCMVDHQSLVSTFRGSGGPGGELETGAAIFRRKWGAENHAL